MQEMLVIVKGSVLHTLKSDKQIGMSMSRKQVTEALDSAQYEV